MGGIVAAWSFPHTNAPEYHKRYSIITFSLCLTVVSAMVYAAGLWVKNGRMVREEAAAITRRNSILPGDEDRTFELNLCTICRVKCDVQKPPSERYDWGCP